MGIGNLYRDNKREKKIMKPGLITVLILALGLTRKMFVDRLLQRLLVLQHLFPPNLYTIFIIFSGC